MRTADAVSPVPAATVATTLAMFVVVYGIVFTMGMYYINRLIARGPLDRDQMPSSTPRLGSGRAISAEGTAAPKIV
jgi:cytochrome d ubiquinol oxidase subunit I